MFRVNSAFISVAFAATLSLPVFSHAQSAPPVDTTSLAYRISVMEEQNAILESQLKQLKIQAEIEQVRSGINAGTSVVQASEKAEEKHPTPPVIAAIEGVDGKFRATFIFEGGVVQTARKNEVLKDGWRISEINHDGVSLVRKGEVIRPGFGRNAPISPVTTPAAGGGIVGSHSGPF